MLVQVLTWNRPTNNKPHGHDSQVLIGGKIFLQKTVGDKIKQTKIKIKIVHRLLKIIEKCKCATTSVHTTQCRDKVE